MTIPGVGVGSGEAVCAMADTVAKLSADNANADIFMRIKLTAPLVPASAGRGNFLCRKARGG